MEGTNKKIGTYSLTRRECQNNFTTPTLTSEQKIKPIVFSTEDNKNVQSALTHYGKTHKIWVHTVNMQDEQLTVEVLRNVHSDCMEIKDGILTAMESVKSYTKEKVGEDGLLELTFKVDNIYQSDAETNSAYYGIQVAKEASDPEDPKKKVLVWVGDQFIISPMNAPYIVRSADLKSIGIKTEATTLTKEEKIALRRRMLCFKNSALMVTDSTSTPEAVQNCDVLVTVDEIEEMKEFEMAEIDRNKICKCEAKIRAFMRTIRVAEGTGEYVKGTRTAQNPQLGYTTWFSGGGNNFSDLSTHPQTINCNSKKTLCSSAAGAYQFMGWTFDELNGYLIEKYKDTYRTVKPHVYIKNKDLAKKYNAKGFSQVAQDRLCITMLKRGKIIPSILKNDIKGAIDKAKDTWVSLPGATAGQPTAKMQDTLDYYNEFLNKELSGITNLHLLPGFLKEFKIQCNCGNDKGSSDWHHPLNRMELRGWYKGGFSTESSDHGKASMRLQNHHGLDLYAPVGTSVFACVDGEVHDDYDSGTYGKTLNIKGTYKGTTYYFFYAHLSARDVKKGDKVTAGGTIGKTGQTGNASGQDAKMDHLHFEVRSTGERTGGKLDPLTTINELETGVNTNPDQTTQTGN